MSFIDELRTPNTDVAQRRQIQYDKEVVALCIDAIKTKCRASKNQRFVQGYLYRYNDEGYTCSKLVSGLPQKKTKSDLRAYKHTYPNHQQSLYIGYIFSVSPNFGQMLKAAVEELGFTDYRIVMTPMEDETEHIYTGAFNSVNVKYEKNGHTGKNIYLEIKW